MLNNKRLFYIKGIITKSVVLKLLVITLLSSSSSSLFAQSNIAPKIKCIVLDPGHGGKDFGCISKDKKYAEKNIVLSVALKLGDMIKEKYPDVKVVYTRKRDVFIPLDVRADIANKNKADLFLSIHVNSAPNSTVANGTETFTMGNHVSNANFELSKRENSVILMEDDYKVKYEGFKPNSPESYIIFSLLQNAHAEQSIEFAKAIQDQFIKGPIRYSRGVKQAGFLVLWKTTMPSVLTELGFISNKNDLKILTSESGQKQLALRLLDAFVNYKNRYERDYSGENIASKDASQEKDSLNSIKEKELIEVVSELDKDKDAKNKEEIVSGQDKEIQEDKVVYHIQILSVSRKLKQNERDLKGESAKNYIVENGLYKYYVGEYSSKQDALNNLADVRKKFKGAFVIGVQNGKIVFR